MSPFQPQEGNPGAQLTKIDLNSLKSRSNG